MSSTPVGPAKPARRQKESVATENASRLSTDTDRQQIYQHECNDRAIDYTNRPSIDVELTDELIFSKEFNTVLTDSFNDATRQAVQRHNAAGKSVPVSCDGRIVHESPVGVESDGDPIQPKKQAVKQ